MKKTSLGLLCLLGSLLLASVASAHVTVYPKEAVQGAYEKFAVRVPTEKDVATVKVEVKFPEDVTISRFEPKPGWNYELTTDASGKIIGVIWSTTGEGLGKTEFGEFYMQGKVSDSATSLVWKAYQTYADGSVVEWVGAEGSDKPASVTTVKPKPAGAAVDSHGNTEAGTQQAVPVNAELAQQQNAAGSLPLYLSIVSLILALAALMVAMRKKR